jgi:cbb3-type cytochrome oxidase maturation protein
MGILILLIPAALLLSCGGVLAYLWAARGRQFDDLDTPAHAALFDDELIEEPINASLEAPSKQPLERGRRSRADAGRESAMNDHLKNTKRSTRESDGMADGRAGLPECRIAGGPESGRGRP